MSDQSHEPILLGVDYDHEPRVTRVEVQYSQNGASDDETLTVESMTEGAGMFMRIKTEGFSLDNPGEMQRILNDFMRRVQPLAPDSE